MKISVDAASWSNIVQKLNKGQLMFCSCRRMSYKYSKYS